VLGFVLPPLRFSDEGLRNALIALWPAAIAYALSFGVIGIMWQNHHAMFRLVERVDRKTVFYNLLLLAGTAFIPFATSVLGSYPTGHTSTFLYGLALTYTATVYNVMLRHLVGRKAFYSNVSADALRKTVVAYRVGWVTYACATLVSLAAPVVSFALYVIVAAYYVIPRGVDDDITDTTST
jgi:uncharacterized membrane protein